MFNMSKIRENSSIILWTLLAFFVMSMTVGGLVGGANIVDRIFGRNQSNLYVGSVEGVNITHQDFQKEFNTQLQNSRSQNQTIDSRGVQNARNSAWNTLVDKIIQDQLINEFDLSSSGEEIYNFLVNFPPAQLQQQLTQSNYFADSSGAFILDAYQSALKTGTYPNNLENYWLVWENYLTDWLPIRKLQNLYSQTSSVSDMEIKTEFYKKNINCTVKYIYVPINDINDSLITVTDDEVKSRYEEDKEKLYKLDASRTVEYVLWSDNVSDVDSSLHSTYLDSINSSSLRFAGEADFSTFNEAVEVFGLNSDTLDIIEDNKNNSGFPYTMGVMRNAVRFAFDSPIGTISDPMVADDGYVVFHIIGEKPTGYKPFSEVEESIQKTLIRENKKDYAKTILQNDFINENSDFSQIAESNEFIKFDTDSLKALGSTFKSIGRSNELSGTLRAMEAGDISTPVTTYSAVAIIELLEKDEFDQEIFDAEFDTIRDRLMLQKSNAVFSTWLSEYKKQIEIEDNRIHLY
ncbi:MAG: SurA N-terminal domain-containing protein [Candidatus Marinimicrobia bacterium]|nr:SurA N-terminal domain-containing protein [Candidatus Neomarinimicrobiota bacterium]